MNTTEIMDTTKSPIASERESFCVSLDSIIGDLYAIKILEGVSKENVQELRHVDDVLERCKKLMNTLPGLRGKIHVPDPNIESVITKLRGLRRQAEQFDDGDFGLTQDASQEIKFNLDLAIEWLDKVLQSISTQK